MVGSAKINVKKSNRDSLWAEYLGERVALKLGDLTPALIIFLFFPPLGSLPRKGEIER